MQRHVRARSVLALVLVAVLLPGCFFLSVPFLNLNPVGGTDQSGDWVVADGYLQWVVAFWLVRTDVYTQAVLYRRVKDRWVGWTVLDAAISHLEEDGVWYPPATWQEGDYVFAVSATGCAPREHPNGYVLAKVFKVDIASHRVVGKADVSFIHARSAMDGKFALARRDGLAVLLVPDRDINYRTGAPMQPVMKLIRIYSDLSRPPECVTLDWDLSPPPDQSPAGDPLPIGGITRLMAVIESDEIVVRLKKSDNSKEERKIPVLAGGGSCVSE